MSKITLVTSRCRSGKSTPGLLQVLLHGQDQGLVLVVPGKFQGAEVGESRDVVNEALEVELHLQGAVPVLNRQTWSASTARRWRRTPRRQRRPRWSCRTGPRRGGHEEPHDLHASPFWLRLNFPSVRGVPGPGPTVARHRGVVGVLLVEPVELIQHRGPRLLQRGAWNGTGPTGTQSGPPSPGRPASHSPGWGRRCRRRPPPATSMASRMLDAVPWHLPRPRTRKQAAARAARPLPTM